MSDESPFVGPRSRMGSGTEVMVDREHGVVVLNQSDISMSEVSGALARQHPEIAALVRWTVQTNGDSGVARQGGVFQRDRYVTPEQIFAQFRVCMDAATNDDVVSNWIETTEAMAFGRMDFQAEDEDEENVWNQIAYDLDLDSRIREMWRELCTFSQFYCVAKGQLVWTPDGPTPIEQMRRGQMVWGMGEGSRGRPGLDVARVTRVERTGVKRIYEVVTRNQTLRVSADHLVAVFCRSGNRESRSQVHTEWVRVSNLVPGDVLVSVGTMPHRRTTYTSDPSLGTARIVGMLVGDGARNLAYEPEKGPTQFKLCVPVGPQRDDWAALLSDELGCTVDVRVDRCCIRFCAPELRQWAAEVMVHKSPDRFIPSWVWLASPKHQLAFLEGYLDADGCKIARGWKIAATSERLVRELKVLCEMLGWGASRTRPGKAGSYGVRGTWTFVAYPETARRQLPSSYARKGVPLDESLCGRTVVSVTDTGLDEEVYDLEVPGLRSFVVEGTVVHNCVTWWGRKDYRVKGTDPKTGVKRKKTFQQVVVPLGLTILDPQKVVPVGNLMFNQEQLCYIADRTERDLLDAAVLNDPQADEVSRQIIVAKYAPPDYERRNLAMQGVNPEWLYVLNPKNVWRHTATRPQYRRFAEVRMASILELLDLKHQLRQMDRAHLIGGTNFIVLVKKGTDHLPARPEEVQNLQGQVSALARMPILVGDHRLTVEIVTPKTDYTLNPDKYSTIDNRLLARLYQMFVIHGGEGSIRGDDAVKLGKVIARGMESRRFMMRRTLERQVFGPTVSANEQLTCEPVLRFHPKRIELDFDPAMVQFMMDARDRGDMSRESYLSALDLDQQDEALWRRREAANWDDVFTMTNVPFSAPGPGHNVPVGPGGKPKTAGGDVAPGGAVMPQGTAPHSHAPDGTPVDLPQLPAGKGRSRTAQKSAGRSQGGNKNGGGAAPGSGQGQAPRRGRPSSK